MQLPMTHDQPSPKNLLARTEIILNSSIPDTSPNKGKKPHKLA
jgi:hypothetical protein